ncbi:helix-turn-helix domain-containing protein [Devosia sp. BK]|nr:helix-turn-helix domain-containing protein [Devosia sp. BK]
MSSFSRNVPELGVTQLAEQLGLPKSTVSRLMAELERAQYLERTDARRYRPGSELLRIGSLYKFGSLPIDRVDALIKAAVASLPASGYMAVNKGLDTIILRMREGISPVRFVVAEGSVVPAYTVAVGKALLSRLTDHELDALVPRHLHSEAPYYDMSRADFISELQQGRDRRWVQLHDMANRGVEAFAAAIRPAGGEAIGFAFSFMATTPPEIQQKILDSLLSIGQSLGAALGDEYWANI